MSARKDRSRLDEERHSTQADHNGDIHGADEPMPSILEALGEERLGDFDRDSRRVQIEWEWDQLLALVGRILDSRHPGVAYEGPRFLQWLAEQERDEEERLPEEEIQRLAQRVVRRAVADGMPLRRIDQRAPRRMAPVTGRLENVADEAAMESCALIMSQSVAAGLGRDIWEEECDQWVELPPDLPTGRYVALTVSGESMTPLMHGGDVVLVRLGPEVARDTVVVARHSDDGYVVKRVGSIGSRHIELLSLNPDFAPMRVPRDGRSVVGTVVLRWCEHDEEERRRF